MKRSTVLLSALSLILAGSNSYAKPLEDILKEKGVISAEDYQSVSKSSPVSYAPGNGVTITSPDRNYSLNLGTSLQLRYTLTDLDDVNNNATKQAQDSSKFELRRIKMYLNGNAYSPDLTYKVMMNLTNLQGGGVKNGGILEETYLNYRLADEFQIRAGQDKIPFGRQFITSSTAQQFVDLSVVSNAFVPGYDTGVMLNGRIANGLVNYNVGGYGGVGQNTYRSTTDNAFAARLTVNPLGDMKYSEGDVEYSEKPLLSVGGSFYRNTLNPSEYNSATATNNNIMFANVNTGWFGLGNQLSPSAKQISVTESADINTAGFDTAFKWRGFSAQGEYFMAQADGQTTGNRLRAEGFYVQAGYFVIPKTLELAGRYSYIDPNQDVAGDRWTESTGAVSWYINKHNLKLQADYTNVHRQALIATTNKGASANPTDDQQVRLQAQLLF
ncbi:OprO/OprP family phosphate-selective porin [Geomonas sp. Red32]|uniref:porin n=1 Tax=Geomonas sp. Red32 TaxID=2912856 RepID=UPI00202CC316|nr:porin [Geomonas sp. Red32]MCM0081229.1 OprO/OprP family phosphate-selective porin [Geomonas sp. Red32]